MKLNSLIIEAPARIAETYSPENWMLRIFTFMKNDKNVFAHNIEFAI